MREGGAGGGGKGWCEGGLAGFQVAQEAILQVTNPILSRLDISRGTEFCCSVSGCVQLAAVARSCCSVEEAPCYQRAQDVAPSDYVRRCCSVETPSYQRAEKVAPSENLAMAPPMAPSYQRAQEVAPSECCAPSYQRAQEGSPSEILRLCCSASPPPSYLRGQAAGAALQLWLSPPPSYPRGQEAALSPPS